MLTPPARLDALLSPQTKTAARWPPSPRLDASGLRGSIILEDQTPRASEGTSCPLAQHQLTITAQTDVDLYQPMHVIFSPQPITAARWPPSLPSICAVVMNVRFRPKVDTRICDRSELRTTGRSGLRLDSTVRSSRRRPVPCKAVSIDG
jgi:hypothetical protein